MTDGPGSEITEVRRKSLIDIIDAMMDPDQGRIVLSWRIEAKQAQAVLLAKAYFDQDIEQATRAERRATQLIEECNAVLLRRPTHRLKNKNDRPMSEAPIASKCLHPVAQAPFHVISRCIYTIHHLYIVCIYFIDS